jgi:hypothetical protein
VKHLLDRSSFSSCPSFNDWLDNQHIDACGPLTILGFQPRPSEVLFRLSPDTYEAAFADFQADVQERLNELVFYDFPTPIAHYYYRFHQGYENDLQRLHFLRDTWEATIDVLHAIALGECRLLGVRLADPMAFKHVLSDSVADRLLNVERALKLAQDQGHGTLVNGIVTTALLDEMRELNRTRNAFSHSAAQSELQAREWIQECQGDLLSVLDDLRGLATIPILRYVGQPDAMTVRGEVFRGHALTRTISPFPLSADQARDSIRFLRQNELLCFSGTRLFSVRPLMHSIEVDSGHRSSLCAYRKARGDPPNRRLEYEVTGDATRREEDRALFKVELDELRALFGLGPD